jgi:hypothetical protein
LSGASSRRSVNFRQRACRGRSLQRPAIPCGGAGIRREESPEPGIVASGSPIRTRRRTKRWSRRVRASIGFRPWGILELLRNQAAASATHTRAGRRASCGR